MNFTQKASKILNINLSKYFLDTLDFFDNANNQIWNYYTISSEIYPQEAFDKYYNLQKITTTILEKIQFYKGLFSNVGYWNLLDKIDSIQQKFNSIKAYPKYAKVNFIKTKEDNKEISETYTLKQNEDVEKLANSKLENWNDILIYNKLKEEDYTNNGGVNIILKSSANLSLNGSDINSIIDIAVGTNLLGKDFPDYYKLDSDLNDLFVDSPQQTFINSIKRLLQLNLGSIPEFPFIGIQKDISAESAKGDGFLFPLLLRQLVSTLETDDSIVNFTITNTSKKEDGNLYMNVSCSNRLGDNLALEEKI